MGDGSEDASLMKCPCGGIAYEPYDEPGKTLCARCGKHLQPGELVASTRLKEQGSGSKVQGPKKEEESMSKIGEGRKPIREIPEIITNRWIYMARVAELQALLMAQGGMTRADLQDKTIKDLRKMVRPLAEGRRRSRRRSSEVEPGKKRKYSRRTIAPGRQVPVDPPPPDRENRNVNDGAGLHVHCMACGFRMEISAEGIRALQKGGKD